MKRFENQNVLVTGAARGIGQVAALEFAREGANIILTDVSSLDDTLEKLTGSGVKTHAVRCDLLNEQEIIDMVKSAADFCDGKIDILINNAGVGGLAQLVEDMKLEDWNRTIGVDLTGAMLVAREVIPYMRKQKSGGIVFTSSNVGKRGLPYRADYVCAKWAVIGLTQTLALELVDDNIRVNAVCPGPVTGELIDEVVDFHASSENRPAEEIHREWAEAAPMKRYVEPEEVAGVMMFLCSEQSSAMTGQALNVTCGFIMN
jgi:NAD(P)-dependent dehydrogenase (short-subunit alcohol dehydrogenase family)